MTELVRAKKHLGQHFLKDLNIASSIVDSLVQVYPNGAVLEVGPGMGVLVANWRARYLGCRGR
jgi:16S rRNA (adenine1518-N6/adenine1519-N6)-dimethyltransferase